MSSESIRRSDDPLSRALDALREAAARGRDPTRHQARELLLALGAALTSGATGEAESAAVALENLVASKAAFRDRWRAAVADELALACAEHVHSVDARFLDHPHYDWEYTTKARERLELRLRAAERLGVPADPSHRARVERADRELAAAAERRAKRGDKPRRDGAR